MSLVSISDQNFEAEVLKSDVPVLVDFWAEWCGPCRMLGPILEEISKEMGTKVKIVKLNIDQNPTTPAQFGVRSIPTMVVFKGGEAFSTKVGVQPKPSLVQWINSCL